MRAYAYTRDRLLRDVAADVWPGGCGGWRPMDRPTMRIAAHKNQTTCEAFAALSLHLTGGEITALEQRQMRGCFSAAVGVTLGKEGEQAAATGTCALPGAADMPPGAVREPFSQGLVACDVDAAVELCPPIGMGDRATT